MTKIKKVYYAAPISTYGEFEDSKRVAIEIRALDFEVYAAAENSAINDKTNEPTPCEIYEGDVSRILDCDIFVVNVTGGHQDGTISEIGVVAGLNEMSDQLEGVHGRYIKIIAYTSNARLLQPQFHEGIPSAGANHLVLGMVDRWGAFVGSEDAMLAELRRIKEDD